LYVACRQAPAAFDREGSRIGIIIVIIVISPALPSAGWLAEPGTLLNRTRAVLSQIIHARSRAQENA
jgi:hypothetical protein